MEFLLSFLEHGNLFLPDIVSKEALKASFNDQRLNDFAVESEEDLLQAHY